MLVRRAKLIHQVTPTRLRRELLLARQVVKLLVYQRAFVKPDILLFALQILKQITEVLEYNPLVRFLHHFATVLGHYLELVRSWLLCHIFTTAITGSLPLELLSA